MKDKLLFGYEIGQLCGEEINITPLVDVKKLTEGDDNPFFATVKALRVGRSRNKKNYTKENLEQVLTQLPFYGHKGHIKEEDIDTTYREPVTIWIGGAISGEWLYLKGYIPPQYETLRKDVALSLKAERPMPVSVLGWYKLIPQGEYYDVKDIRIISTDWGNAGLEGVQGAQVVEVGKETEDKSNKEEDMPTKEEILAALSADEIKQARPDLVKSLQSEMLESEEEKKQRDEEKKKMETLEKENKDMKKQVLDTHREKLLAEIEDENIRTLAGDLLQGETVEELDKNWKLVKEKLSKIDKSGMPIVTAPDDEKDKKAEGSEFIQDRLLDKNKEE